MKTSILMLSGAAALMLAACGQKTEPAASDPDAAPTPMAESAPAAAAPSTATPQSRSRATDSVPPADETGVMQPIDPPPTLPDDKAGMGTATGTSPPQR